MYVLVGVNLNFGQSQASYFALLPVIMLSYMLAVHIQFRGVREKWAEFLHVAVNQTG